jgi:predicted deacylase
MRIAIIRAGLLMILVSATYVVAVEAAEQQVALIMAGQQVAPGQRLDIDLRVVAGPSDPATYIPITVFHGAQPGQTLALTAGVHGYEFPPILAAQELLSRIDPARLRGTVILVRLANVAAFEERAPYVNPYDRKNLNRVFPGRPNGSQAERIAWTITTEVIRRCDVHVELHGGDGAEWLEEFVGIYGGSLSTGYETARAVGLAFGFRNVVRYSMDSQEQIDSGRSLNRQAVANKKPTVLVEIGENGRRDTRFVTAIVEGVMNSLRVLEMLDGQPNPPRSDTRWFESTASTTSNKTGIFTPASTHAREVKEGEPLGTVRDYTGRVIEEIVSPVDGYALYGLAGPPVKAGESVVTIGLPARGPL